MFGPSKKAQQAIEEQLLPGDRLVFTTNGEWKDLTTSHASRGVMQTLAVTEQGVLTFASDAKVTVTLGMKFVLGDRLFAQSRSAIEAVLQENGHTVALRERATGQDVAEATFGVARKRAAAEYVQAANA